MIVTSRFSGVPHGVQARDPRRRQNGRKSKRAWRENNTPMENGFRQEWWRVSSYKRGEINIILKCLRAKLVNPVYC